MKRPDFLIIEADQLTAKALSMYGALRFRRDLLQRERSFSSFTASFIAASSLSRPPATFL